MQFSGLKWFVAAVALFVGQVQASLIVNGGFEANVVPNKSWSYFSSAVVPGWQGSNLEIWRGLNGVLAPEGLQHAELNADGTNSGVWTIFQTFDTTVGQQYDFSFAYRARQSTQEAFTFRIGDVEALIKQHSTSVWQQYRGSFIASSTSSTIRFTSANVGTYGNFLDDVSVTTSAVARQAVSSPASLALLGLGLLVLGMRRRRQG